MFEWKPLTEPPNKSGYVLLAALHHRTLEEAWQIQQEVNTAVRILQRVNAIASNCVKK